jgi:PEP-CTERM motif-containing protein
VQIKSAGRILVLSTLALIGGLLAASAVKADPLLFSNVVALQNQGLTKVDLFSHPGTTLLGPQLTFLVDITGTLPQGVTNTLSVTYSELGSAPITQTFIIPAFGTIPPPFTQLFTFMSPGATSSGTIATLTIDIIGSSPDFVIPGGLNAGQRVDTYAFSFNVVKPVPEPATMFLLGGGLAAVAAHARRRHRNRNLKNSS